MGRQRPVKTLLCDALAVSAGRSGSRNLVPLVSNTREVPAQSSFGLEGGRYWIRTSDLCRVKAAL